MTALKTIATALLLWNAFVISAWAQGQLIMANNSATRIWVEGDNFLAAGPNSQVAIYAASGSNQPHTALRLQTGAITNLFSPGLFQGGTRTLAIPPGPATVQVRVWTGAFPSYEAAAAAVNGGDWSVLLGYSKLLNINLTLSPRPAAPLTAAGLNQICMVCQPALQAAYVRWGNTTATRIYTNDCNGTIGLISGTQAYRFGLYLGQWEGAPPSFFNLVAIATNSASPGSFGISESTLLPMGVIPGIYRLGFQVRAWPLSAGATFEEALTNTAPGLLGMSDVGYVTPSIDAATAPQVFGTAQGQVRGFELRGPCPEVAVRRMAPDGPLKITRMARDNTVTWSNVINTAGASATYRFYAASGVSGPYTNWSLLTANTARVTFTNPYSGPSLFFKVEWTDAPAPQPLGTWDYQAFDGTGSVMAAGVFTFTSNVPGTVTHNFSRIQTSGTVNLHPAGPGTLEATATGSSNVIEMRYSSDFHLRGQMVGDYYAGDWFATDYLLWTPENPPPPGTPTSVTHTGRFVARRRF